MEWKREIIWVLAAVFISTAPAQAEEAALRRTVAIQTVLSDIVNDPDYLTPGASLCISIPGSEDIAVAAGKISRSHKPRAVTPEDSKHVENLRWTAVEGVKLLYDAVGLASTDWGAAWNHNGTLSGYTGDWFYFPKSGIIWVMIANSDISTAVEPLFQSTMPFIVRGASGTRGKLMRARHNRR